MIKTIGCILMVVGCAGIGFWRAECMRKRLEEMQDLKKYVLFMRGEMGCGNKTLPETFVELGKKSKGVWKNFFCNIGMELGKMDGRTLAEIWQEGIKSQLSNSFLREREKEEWKNLGDNLGYLDKDMQLHMLELFQFHLRERMEDERKEVKNQSKLSQALGVMSGIFLTVLLI